MGFKKYLPSSRLSPFIKCYYLIEGDYKEHVSDIFFADGCIEVVFNVGLEFYRENEKECWAKIIGQITKPLIVNAIGKGKSFGIWFYPQTFSLFSNIAIDELNDKAIALDNIFSQDFIDLVGNCLYKDDINNLIEGVDSYMINILRPPQNKLKQNIVDHAVTYILRHKENSNISKLVKDCNISNRYLQKIFIEKIGVSPKFFLRTIRFQQVLHYLSNYQINSLTSLSYEAGYYDQSHFIKEFKEFTGLIPSQYSLENHPINKYFINK
jgi:AraC-like DNA-binding protein